MRVLGSRMSNTNLPRQKGSQQGAIFLFPVFRPEPGSGHRLFIALIADRGC